MRKSLVIGFSVLAASGGPLLLAFAAEPSAVSDALAVSKLGPQSSAAQGVTVTVTPRDLSNDTKLWEFEVAFSTHTQDLRDDLTKVAILMSDDGKRYPPVGWQGDGPGGHHRKGMLAFKPVSPRPQSVSLQIQRAEETATRTFHWQLK